MHRHALSPVRILSFALLALVGAGCGQAEGERCQVDSDCKSGLYCENKASSFYAENGVCRSTKVPTSTPDAASNTDTSTSTIPDAGTKIDTLPKDGALDSLTKLDTKADTAKADTGADMSVAPDTAVDAPQSTDAPADVAATADASDGRVD